MVCRHLREEFLLPWPRTHVIWFPIRHHDVIDLTAGYGASRSTIWSMRVSFASAEVFSAQRRRGGRGFFGLPSGTCGAEAARRSRCACCRSYTFGRALCGMGVYQRVEYAPPGRQEFCGCRLRERFAEVEKTSLNPRGGGAGCRGSPGSKRRTTTS